MPGFCATYKNLVHTIASSDVIYRAKINYAKDKAENEMKKPFCGSDPLIIRTANNFLLVYAYPIL